MINILPRQLYHNSYCFNLIYFIFSFEANVLAGFQIKKEIRFSPKRKRINNICNMKLQITYNFSHFFLPSAQLVQFEISILHYSTGPISLCSRMQSGSISTDSVQEECITGRYLFYYEAHFFVVVFQIKINSNQLHNGLFSQKRK